MKGAYVYAVIVDGTRRYVGKGRGNRIAAHMKMVRSIVRRRAAGEVIRATIFYNRLTKAWLNGAEIEFEIIAEGLTDQAAFELEIKEIASCQTLWNMTPGGHGGGSAGRQVSLDTRAKSSASNKKTWAEGGLKQNQSDRMKLIWLRPEYRESQHKIQSESAKKAIGDKARARWADPAFRTRMKAALSTPEYFAKQSTRLKAQWNDPNWRRRMISSRKREV